MAIARLISTARLCWRSCRRRVVSQVKQLNQQRERQAHMLRKSRLKRKAPLRSRKAILSRRTSLKKSPKRSLKSELSCETRTPAKPAIEIVEDPTSPDGIRELRTGEAWEASRFAAYQFAKGLCQGCKTAHSVSWPRGGEAHHIIFRGAGGAHRDDRPLIPMQTIDSEPNLARWRWKRNLLWTCFDGHQLLHRIMTAEVRRNLLKFCSCGLLNCLESVRSS